MILGIDRNRRILRIDIGSGWGAAWLGTEDTWEVVKGTVD